MPLDGEAVSASVFCGELVQMVIGGIVFAGRETGKGADVGRLCTLHPDVKMQRAKRVLQTMVAWCLVPSPERAAGSLRTDRAHWAPVVTPLPGGLRWEPGGADSYSGRREADEANAARLRQLRALQCSARFCSIPAARARGR